MQPTNIKFAGGDSYNVSPCPFPCCGSASVDLLKDHLCRWYYVECQTCFASGPTAEIRGSGDAAAERDAKDRAVDKWNELGHGGRSMTRSGTRWGMRKTIELTLEFSDWAEWVAVDEDGSVFEYAEEPHCGQHQWIPVGVFSRKFRIDDCLPKDWDWRNTKRRLKDYR